MSKSQLYVVPTSNEPLVENHPQEDDNHKYGNGGGGDDMLERVKKLGKVRISHQTQKTPM